MFIIYTDLSGMSIGRGNNFTAQKSRPQAAEIFNYGAAIIGIPEVLSPLRSLNILEVLAS